MRTNIVNHWAKLVDFHKQNIMLIQSTTSEYIKKYGVNWASKMPPGCPPPEILIAEDHPFFRMSHSADKYNDGDFLTYYETNTNKDWGSLLPLAVGLSLIDNEGKAKKNLKLPMFRKYKGVIKLILNPHDGVLKQTGVHHSHYTWWRTTLFSYSNLQMLQL